jgi:hypothetical protein
MKQVSPSDGYHRRLLYPEILRDMIHAAFQMRPYRDQNHQSERRSNTTNAGVKHAPQAPDRPVAQEDLGFHPALAYKYSGERGACKVVIPSEAKQSRGCNAADEVCEARLSIPWNDLKVSATGLLDFARDDKKTQNRFRSPGLFAERWR